MMFPSTNLLILVATIFSLVNCDTETSVRENLNPEADEQLKEMRNLLEKVDQQNIDPSILCDDIELVNSRGIKIKGTRDCSVQEINNCENGGDTNCLITEGIFLAISPESIKADDIKSGVELAGVAGKFSGFSEKCSHKITTNCVISGNYRSVKKSILNSSVLLKDFLLGGILGEVDPGYGLCLEDGEKSCITNRKYKSVDTSLLASKTLSGETVAGISGTYSPDFPDPSNVLSTDTVNGISGTFTNCHDNVQIGCLATNIYKAADLTNLLPTHIKTGIAIAGVVGTYSGAEVTSCSVDGQTDCKSNDNYMALDMTKVTAGNIRKGVTLAGVTGDYPSIVYKLPSFGTTSSLASGNFTLKMKSAATFEYWDAAGNYYQSSGSADILASNIINSATIFGEAGTVVETVPDCAANGATDCVTTTTYKGADLTNLSASNVKNGVTIAGTLGAYPSSTYKLPGAGTAASLTNSTFNSKIKSNTAFEYWDAEGTRYQSAGDSDLVVTNIVTSNDLFGTTGTMRANPADCSSNAEVGCVSTATYKGANLTNLSASNIKNGTTIAGVLGDYPSATYKLPSAGGAAGLTSSNYATKILDNTAFEYWDSTGARQANSGDSDIAIANIRTAITILGVTGSAIETPADCSSNAEVGCISTATYKGADLANLNAGNIKNGVTIAGQAGDYPSATYPLPSASGTADLTAATFAAKAADATAFEYWDSTGSRSQNNGDADIVVAKIRTSVELFGVTGSVVENPSDCSSNAETGCVTTSTYKGADLTNLSAGNIKSGVTIAGQAGDYPSSTYKLSGAGTASGLTNGTFTSKIKSNTAFEYWDEEGTRYQSAGDSDLVATNIVASYDVFGTIGTMVASPSDCSSNAEVGCVSTATYKGADLTNLSAGNIKNGTTIAGVTGDYPSATFKLPSAGGAAGLTSSNYATKILDNTAFEYWDSTGVRQANSGDSDIAIANLRTATTILGVTGSVIETPADCSSNGEQSCASTTTYKAADLTNLTAANIKNGVTIAGQGGDYPSSTYTLPSASGTADLTAATFAAKAADATAFEYWDSTGSRFQNNGDADIVAVKIRDSIDLFGVTGSVDEAPANCSSNAQTNCVTTSTYKGADLTNLSTGNIKSGITIAGQAGDYPSSTYKLPSAGGAAGLTNATFNAKIKNNTAFEYWDEEGTRHTSAGNSDIDAANIKNAVSIFGTSGTVVGAIGVDAWDVRYGVDIAGVTGNIKTNCRSQARLSTRDNTSSPAGSGLDVWDTVPDLLDGSYGSMPPDDPWSNVEYNCGIENWEDVSTLSDGFTPTTCTSSSNHCMFRDRITNLIYSDRVDAGDSHSTALARCADLNYGGFTDWRLPSQKALLNASIHGITSVISANFIPSSSADKYWTSTTYSISTSQKWAGFFSQGYLNAHSQTDSYDVACVRDGS